MGLRLLFLGLTLIAGSGSATAQPACGPDLILSVPLGEADMQAASRRARAELPGFLERLAAPAPDETEFMVAYDIIAGDGEELVWVEDLGRSSTSITGILRSQPQRANASAGDQVVLAESDVIDWAYREGAVMQGGYTYRVLISRMCSDESAMLRLYLGW